jgi:CubicO group peptidase (beta-lactamase class C family)
MSKSMDLFMNVHQKNIAKTFLCFMFILAVQAFCSGSSQSKAEKIDLFMEKCHQYRIFDGTILVAEGGKVIYKEAFGLANREWSVGNTLDSKFIIGSISKQFTAVLILQLVQEGQLSLDEKISTYLSNFPKDKGEKVSIHHLLCHSSGIPNNQHFENWYTELWQHEYTLQSLLELFYPLDLEFEPGLRFAYSNTGYSICAAIIEAVTKKSYEEVLNERILRLLGMENSGLAKSDLFQSRMAKGYTYWNFRFSNPPYANPSSSMGAGSIYSTVEDMFKWDRALSSFKLLDKEHTDLMFNSHMPLRGENSYGYGWVVGHKNLPGVEKSLRFCEHSGNQPGYSCHFFRIPEENNLIVLLSNIDHTDLRLIQQGLLNILYGRPAVVKKPISLILADCQTHGDLTSKLKNFSDNRTGYAIRRDAVNGLGFQFISKEKIDMGLAVLEFNAGQFPESPWVYESLGEAYLKAGEREKALMNLRKTLELDPENTNVRNKIKELKKRS